MSTCTSGQAQKRKLAVLASASNDLDSVKWVSATLDDGDMTPGMFGPVSDGLADHQGVRNQVQPSGLSILKHVQMLLCCQMVVNF